MTNESYDRIIDIIEKHIREIKENPIEGIHDEELIASYEKSIEEAKKLKEKFKDSAE